MNRLLGQPIICSGEGYAVVTGCGGCFYASLIYVGLCIDLKANSGIICCNFWLNGCQDETISDAWFAFSYRNNCTSFLRNVTGNIDRCGTEIEHTGINCFVIKLNCSMGRSGALYRIRIKLAFWAIIVLTGDIDLLQGLVVIGFCSDDDLISFFSEHNGRSADLDCWWFGRTSLSLFTGLIIVLLSTGLFFSLRHSYLDSATFCGACLVLCVVGGYDERTVACCVECWSDAPVGTVAVHCNVHSRIGKTQNNLACNTVGGRTECGGLAGGNAGRISTYVSDIWHRSWTLFAGTLLTFITILFIVQLTSRI